MHDYSRFIQYKKEKNKNVFVYFRKIINFILIYTDLTFICKNNLKIQKLIS